MTRLPPHVLYVDEWRDEMTLHLTVERNRGNPHVGRTVDENACAEELRRWLTPDRTFGDLIVSTATEHYGRFDPIVEVLVDRGPTIRRARLGALSFPDFQRGSYIPDDPEKDGSSWSVEVPGLSALLGLPGIRTLVVQANKISWWGSNDSILAPSLEELALRTDAIDPDLVTKLGSVSFPKLISLELWAGDLAHDWGGEATAFTALLSSDRLPVLRELTIPSDVADDLVTILADSSLLPRLRILRISNGGLTDTGSRRIRERWARFSGLVELDVQNNWLSPGESRALAAMGGVNVRDELQRSSHAEYRLCNLPVTSLLVDPGWLPPHR